MITWSRTLNMVLCFTAIAVVATVAACSSKQDDSKEAHLKRAAEYLTAGQYYKAEQEYRQVLRNDPADSAAQQQLAVIYYEQGQLRQAFPLLKKSAEQHPENLDIQLNLALIYFAGR